MRGVVSDDLGGEGNSMREEFDEVEASDSGITAKSAT